MDANPREESIGVHWRAFAVSQPGLRRRLASIWLSGNLVRQSGGRWLDFLHEEAVLDVGSVVSVLTWRSQHTFITKTRHVIDAQGPPAAKLDIHRARAIHVANGFDRLPIHQRHFDRLIYRCHNIPQAGFQACKPSEFPRPAISGTDGMMA